MSTRKQLFEAIAAALEQLDAVDKVMFGIANPGERNVIAIVPALDEFTRSSKLTHRSTLSFAIRTVVPEMHQQSLYEYEDVAPQIKTAMNADKTWGGLVYDTILQSEKWLYPDAQWNGTGVDINYVIEYKPDDNFS